MLILIVCFDGSLLYRKAEIIVIVILADNIVHKRLENPKSIGGTNLNKEA